MAEVIGMKGFRIEKGADVEPVISRPRHARPRARRRRSPSPPPSPCRPTITAGEAKGLALGLGKLALMGRFSATMDMIKSNIRLLGGRLGGGDLSGERSPPPNALLSPSQDFQLYRIPVPIFPCGAEANVYLF